MNKKNHIIAIDINADVGEGFDNEAQLMPFLSSCNIACGGHAGDELTMQSVVKLAQQHQVKIGAHPSFPDRENFGRHAMAISPENLLSSLISQVNGFVEVLKAESQVLHHIKPHGALYNFANTDTAYAEVVVLLMKHFGSSVKLYAPYGSLMAEMALQNGIEVAYEVFADRNYNDDLTLVQRTHPNALIEDGDELVAHVLCMLEHQKVRTINNTEKPIKADTICIHGDHPQALRLLETLATQLSENGIKVR